MRKINKEDLQTMSKEEIFQVLKEVSNELQQPESTKHDMNLYSIDNKENSVIFKFTLKKKDLIINDDFY